MVLTRVENPLQFGVVITDKNGKVERFLEKPSWGEVFSDTINTGIYILEPEVFNYVPENTDVDFSKNLFPQLLKEGKALYGYIADGYWKDIGNHDEYRFAHYDILDEKVKINVLGTKKKINGKTVILISHRIVSLMEADKILVLEKGEAVQFGTHAELVAQDGIYKRIYDAQSSITEEGRV